jgi:hypothetical protein
MFEVISVVKEKPVIQPAIVAGRSLRMLIVPMHETEKQAQEITGNIDFEEELWSQCHEACPPPQDHGPFKE